MLIFATRTTKRENMFPRPITYSARGHTPHTSQTQKNYFSENNLIRGSFPKPRSSAPTPAMAAAPTPVKSPQSAGPRGRCKNRHAPLLSDGRPNPYVHPFVNLYSSCERLGRRIWKHVQTHPFIRFSKKKTFVETRHARLSPPVVRLPGADPRPLARPSNPNGTVSDKNSWPAQWQQGVARSETK